MNLIEFLKTFTKINNDFIDDFFRLYDPNDKYNFSINLQDIAKWMNINKINYKIIKGKVKDTILLTPKCFKLMAMQSKMLIRNTMYF